MGKDLNKLAANLEAAQKRVADLQRAAEEQDRTAARAAGELERCVDDGEALQLLARQTTSRNRAVQLRAELVTAKQQAAEAKRQLADAQLAELRAEAEAGHGEAVAGLWGAFHALEVADAAEAAFLDAKSKLEGFPHSGSRYAGILQAVGDMLSQLGEAQWVGNLAGERVLSARK